MTGHEEYKQLVTAGLSDPQIHMLRNTGASHADILAWAKKQRKAEREFVKAFTPNKHGEYA